MAAAEEKNKLREEAEKQVHEAGVEQEVSQEYQSREEQTRQYQEKVEKVTERERHLEDMVGRREKELAKIEELKGDIGLKSEELSAYPKAKREIKQSGLTGEEADPYLKEIREEQSKVITEKKRLRSKLKEYVDDSSMLSDNIEKASKQEGEKIQYSEAPTIDPNSEAMGRIQEDAMKENTEFDLKIESDKVKNSQRLEKIHEQIKSYEAVLNYAETKDELTKLVDAVKGAIRTIGKLQEEISRLQEEKLKVLASKTLFGSGGKNEKVTDINSKLAEDEAELVGLQNTINEYKRLETLANASYNEAHEAGYSFSSIDNIVKDKLEMGDYKKRISELKEEESKLSG